MIALGIQLCLCLSALTPAQEGVESEPDFGYRLELAHTLSLVGGPSQAADISPDGRYLVSGGRLGDVVICDLETLEIRPLAQLSDRGVWSVAFSPNGKWIAIGGEQLIVVTLEGDVVYSHPAFDCSGLAWTQDSLQLAASVNTEGVILLDTTSWEVQHNIRTSTRYGGALRYEKQETVLVLQELSGRFWRANIHEEEFLPVSPKPQFHWPETPYQKLRKWLRHLHQVRHRSFLIRPAPHGRTLALNYSEGWLHLGSHGEGTVLFAYLHQSKVDDIAFSPAGQFLCATGKGTTIFRLENGKAVHRYPESRSISPGTEEGTFLMVYAKGLVQIHAESGSVQHQILRPEEMDHPDFQIFGGWNEGGRKLSLSPDGSTLVVSGGFWDFRHPLINLATGEWKTVEFIDRVTDIAWLPNSSAFYLTGTDSQHGYSGSISRFQRDGTSLATIHQTGGDSGGPATTVTSSPDGKRVVYATRMSEWFGGGSYPQAFLADAESLQPLNQFSWQIFSARNLQWARYLDDDTLLGIGGSWQHPALGLAQEQDIHSFQRLEDIGSIRAVLSPKKDFVAVGEGPKIRVFRILQAL